MAIIPTGSALLNEHGERRKTSMDGLKAPSAEHQSQVSASSYSRPRRTSFNSALSYSRHDTSAASITQRSPDDEAEFKAQMMISWLHMEQERNAWKFINTGDGQGIVLKKAKGQYVCLPEELETDRSGLFRVLKRMNVAVSILPQHLRIALQYSTICV
jgi:hypothetical protein